MTDRERIKRGYVYEGCFASITRKGKKIPAALYGLRCFPIWRKPKVNNTKAMRLA